MADTTTATPAPMNRDDLDRIIRALKEIKDAIDTRVDVTNTKLGDVVSKLAAMDSKLSEVARRLDHIENDKLEAIKLGVAPINGPSDRIAMLLGRLVNHS